MLDVAPTSRPVAADRGGRCGVVARTIWTLLSVVHVWPLLLVIDRWLRTPDTSTTVSLLMLAAVTAFFAAKACDARLLRTRRPGLEATALLLCGALIHPPTAAVEHAELLALAPAVAVLGVVARQSGPRPRLPSSWLPRLSLWVMGTLMPSGLRSVAAAPSALAAVSRTRRGLLVTGALGLPPPSVAL